MFHSQKVREKEKENKNYINKKNLARNLTEKLSIIIHFYF